MGTKCREGDPTSADCPAYLDAARCRTCMNISPKTFRINNNMKVLQISTSAQLGGAGIAAYRLHKGLRSLGVESVMLVNRFRQREEYIVGPSSSLDKIGARLSPVLDRIPGRFLKPRLDRLSASWFPNRLSSRVRELKPDILNLHWVNDGFMRIETLAGFQQPIVWTLHDMWPFAGGEHYVGESRRYIEGYSRHNRPPEERGPDVNRWVWDRKRKAWSKMTDMVIVTPSYWLADCARKSVLFSGLRVEVLPNGIDHEKFRPQEHRVVRDLLGMPQDKKLLLFGAESATSDRRKGFHLLTEALKKLEAQGISQHYELIVFGSLSGKSSFSMKTHYLGNLRDEISMALVFAAVDVFIAPSTEDNLPNTVLEALSCGTPVVAFNSGGIPDMVSHRKNGYLAARFDTSDMARGLTWVLENQERWNRLSEVARSTVEKSFTLSLAAKRYQDLYRHLLQDKQGSRN